MTENEIPYLYEQYKFVLQEKFEYNSFEGKKGVDMKIVASCREITYTPDFIDPEGKWIIETKGQRTPDFDLKWKMLKYLLHKKKIKIDLYLPRNQKQLVRVIETIKNGKRKSSDKVHKLLTPKSGVNTGIHEEKA